ncbi:DUF5625 family protein [Nitrobacter winogradskyi]|uniref:Uncharacterized protein n=2 Tax=Nitrobacter winogradskyi TaxID=913 RepID=A0ACC6AJJ9_NITWI|nr:DUF5625 family protein [Nitrobacter winogradskyi]MCP1999155.1 hypothetical protein [Nitrobacter winogradskyi]GEC14652.1 hypothetical protein NWI01_05440 [Nitrobacter winogradskyi]
MGPITYSLCQKQIIGLAMFITGLCAFPPLIAATDVSLRESGLILDRAFNVPVDKSYQLELEFVFPSIEARVADKLVGDGDSSSFCTSNTDYDAIPDRARARLGLPIPFRVVVRAKPGEAPVVDQTFHSLCNMSHIRNSKGRMIGRLHLNRGNHRIEVYSLQPQPAFNDIEVQLSLVSGHGK